jgi:uncharacterized membrane-anchored protein YhcB (DUF1043 family)
LETLLQTPAFWALTALALVAGILIGRAIAGGGARREAERARALEEQLARVEAEQTRYRAQVSDHFVETSRRLRDLTLQYKSVYEHLADGARSLCPEGAVAIAPSLAEALPATAGAPLEAADDAQLDLDLDEEPGRWSRADVGIEREDDLGPLLDEDVPAPPTTTESLSRFR